LKKKPLYSPTPFFALTALFSLVPVLNNKYPGAFFPAVGSDWVEIVSTLAGVYGAFLGMNRLWTILQVRAAARVWVKQLNITRLQGISQDENNVVNAGRSISRLVRNADSDLREIYPDFTWNSLKRLQGYLPTLLLEIQSEESAAIRLGIVGTYVGETLCRTQGWQWGFRSNPDLKQFAFLPSMVQKNGKQIDPFNLAAQAMAEKVPLLKFLEPQP
jgi:hypothetical protein